jgi:hypothetical protein
MALKAAKFFKRPDALIIVVISDVAVAFPHHNQDFSLQPIHPGRPGLPTR